MVYIIVWTCIKRFLPNILDSLEKLSLKRAKLIFTKTGEMVEPTAYREKLKQEFIDSGELVVPKEDKENDVPEPLVILKNGIEIENKIYKKSKQEKESLLWQKVVLYIGQTLIPFDFSEEDIAQIILCFDSLVHNKRVKKDIERIKKEGKKPINQQDIVCFTWTISKQYRIESELVASFIKTTFSDWFENTKEDVIAHKGHNWGRETHIKFLKNFDHIVIDDKNVNKKPS